MRASIPVGPEGGPDLVVVATTAFYTYLGQLVPQKPKMYGAGSGHLSSAPRSHHRRISSTSARSIADGKGLCLTCHTIGQDGRASLPRSRRASARGRRNTDRGFQTIIDYLAQSLLRAGRLTSSRDYNPGMPKINDKSPIGLTDDEILAVMAWLQSLGGDPDGGPYADRALLQREGS